MATICAWLLGSYVHRWGKVGECVCVYVRMSVCVFVCVSLWLREPCWERKLSCQYLSGIVPLLLYFFADPIVVAPHPPLCFPSSCSLPPNSYSLGLRSRWRPSFVQACWPEIRKTWHGTNKPSRWAECDGKHTNAGVQNVTGQSVH